MTTSQGEGAAGKSLQEQLGAFFAEAGYHAVETSILQPVEIFLELSGEDIRRRIFLTQDIAGNELCLRPEFTIPVCRAHQNRDPGRRADYSYCGPVFRLASAEPSELSQAGIESIGREDIAAADAEIVGLAIGGLRKLGIRDVSIRFGDMGLTVALFDALVIPDAVKRKTLRALTAGKPLDDIASPSATEDPNDSLLAAIGGQDPLAARAFVENILEIAGISRVGGRTAADIAQRFLDKATAKANGGSGLNGDNRAIVEAYRAITGSPDEAIRQVRLLVSDVGLKSVALDQSLDLFEERTGFIEARHLSINDFYFSGGFARNLDYYTGFVFEVYRASLDSVSHRPQPLVGGGRYDGLLSRLGAPMRIPAVGCGFWMDRLSPMETYDV